MSTVDLRTRFVVVNDRIPCNDRYCALCGDHMDEGYVRDSQTQLIYCDTECFEFSAHEAVRVLKNRQRKAS